MEWGKGWQLGCSTQAGRIPLPSLQREGSRFCRTSGLAAGQLGARAYLRNRLGKRLVMQGWMMLFIGARRIGIHVDNDFGQVGNGME
jgi:hypothetical protein